MKRLLILSLAVAAALPASAFAAQEPAEPVCTVNAPPPAGFAAWEAAKPLQAAASAAAPAAELALGRAADVALHPESALRHAVTPGRAAPAGSHGGMVELRIDRPGTYHIAASARSWLDLVRDGRALPSAAHGRAPACTGIRKIVDFQLAPGSYRLQISGAAEPSIRVMVAGPDAAPKR